MAERQEYRCRQSRVTIFHEVTFSNEHVFSFDPWPNVHFELHADELFRALQHFGVRNTAEGLRQLVEAARGHGFTRPSRSGV